MDITLSIDDSTGEMSVNGRPVKSLEQALQMVGQSAQEALSQNPSSEESAMMESFPEPQSDEQAEAQPMPPLAGR